MRLLLSAWLSLIVCHAALSVTLPVEDVPFRQEYHEPFPLPTAEANDTRSIVVDQRDHVWVATGDGVWILADEEWHRHPGLDGPVYDLWLDEETVWAGTWNGLFALRKDEVYPVLNVTRAISVITGTERGILAMGPDGSWIQEGGWQRLDKQWSWNVRDALTDEAGVVWIATGMGLFRWQGDTVEHLWESGDLFSAELNGLAIAPDGRLWIAAWGGLDVYENGAYVQHIGPGQGLPYHDIRSITFDADGVAWMTSPLGVIRHDGEQFSLRHSRRWLLSDDARDLALDSSGTAWVATAAGVSAIRHQWMTLQEKAAFFHDRLRERHVRPPGLVEKCRYPDPSDRSVWIPEDDDNDGQYTSQYLVMESYRYAVTGDPEARRMADEAFEALRFLQTVTGTDGFVARSVIPPDRQLMHDANRTYTPQQALERRVTDPRYKPVEERWRLSDDGQWLWKGDTSSDEITGHLYGYYWYYKLAATDERREEIRDHVRTIMDYIIDRGYNLIDIDGTHTRWGVWSPEQLLHDPDWNSEAAINAFEMLSFLRVTHAMTGDEKYQQEYERLIRDYNYLELASRPKRYTISARTHIDDILLALAAPGLLDVEEDPVRRQIYLEGYTWAYQTVKHDMNPFFNFSAGKSGVLDIPVQESVFFLRDAPLDLIQWRVDSSRREDIDLVREPMLGTLQTSRMLPPSERGVMRWDKNPWAVVSGDFSHPEGILESSGVYWLLPYWMGRYHGYIGVPD